MTLCASNSALIAQFESLKLDPVKKHQAEDSKQNVIEWLDDTFPSCDIRDGLLAYLRRKDVHLKRGYYYRDKGLVLFYFKVFDGQDKEIHRKKIGLKPRQGVKVTNKYVKRFCTILLLFDLIFL